MGMDTTTKTRGLGAAFGLLFLSNDWASRLVGVSLLSCCIGTSLGQLASSPTAPNSTAAASTATPFLLGPGDLISVQVFGTPDLSGPIRLDQDGWANLPLGSHIRLSGLTPNQAATVIEKQLIADQIMLNPHVAVLITQSATQSVTVLGEVLRPGTFSLLIGPHSLYDALSAAGGPSSNEGSHITIAHASDPSHPIEVPVTSPNYSDILRLTPIQPGDTIVVSKAELIYVVGDVGKPGSYPILSGLPVSILNIMSLAQGINSTASSKHAAIVRLNGDKAITIPINLDRILKLKDPNIFLQASDVLVVPRSAGKAFVQFALPTLTNAVVTSAVSAAIVR